MVRCFLRAGRKIGSTPKIAGLMRNNTYQIKGLLSRPRRRQGKV
jgi:hypothetical protein